MLFSFSTIGSPYDHPLRGSAKKATNNGSNTARELFAHKTSGRGPATFSRARSVSLSDADNFAVAGKAGFSIKGAGRAGENGDRRRGMERDERDEGFSIMGAGRGGRRDRAGDGEDLFAGRNRGRASALKG